MNNKLFFVAIALILGVGSFVIISNREPMPEKVAHSNSKGQIHKLTTYKSPTCGCCGNWVGYMNGLGYKMEVVNTEDTESIKQKYGVPEDLYSCHTTIVNDGEYVIEGHIPNETISRFLEETPDVRGIAMADMPSGSPGMPGNKEPFNIMQLNKDDTVNVYEVR